MTVDQAIKDAFFIYVRGMERDGNIDGIADLAERFKKTATAAGWKEFQSFVKFMINEMTVEPLDTPPAALH